MVLTGFLFDLKPNMHNYCIHTYSHKAQSHVKLSQQSALVTHGSSSLLGESSKISDQCSAVVFLFFSLSSMTLLLQEVQKDRSSQER